MQGLAVNTTAHQHRICTKSTNCIMMVARGWVTGALRVCWGWPPLVPNRRRLGKRAAMPVFCVGHPGPPSENGW